MNILIATPLDATEPGGPAQYTANLQKEFSALGHTVEIVSFSSVRKYVSGVRHLRYFLKVFAQARSVDVIIILDTFSVALPALCAGWIRGKKTIIRTGGDFVWEHYVERTKEKILLSEFYTQPRNFSIKEHISFFIQKYVLVKLVSIFVFSTDWQKNIWDIPYGMKNVTVRVIENAYVQNLKPTVSHHRTNTIVWVGRDLFLKNRAPLKLVMDTLTKQYPEIMYVEYTQTPHAIVVDVLATCRALVIPSLSEVSPNLAIEALSLGTPVLLTHDCGLRDILNSSVTWIDPLSIESIQHAVESIISDEGYERAKEHTCSFVAQRTYTEVAKDFISILTN